MGLACSSPGAAARRRSISGVVLLGAPLALGAAGCNVLLDIDDYTFGPTGGSSSSVGSGGAGGSGTTTSTGTAATGGQAGCVQGETQSCYSGQPATLNVGPCKAGVSACDAGGTWGACMGEIVPLPEVCGDGIDDDCDGALDNGCPCIPRKSEPCYSGPAGTSGVGACVAGLKTCLPDGMSYTACQGQVLPSFELCKSSSIDENCDGVGCVGATTWSRRYGDSQFQGSPSISVGPSGDIALGGHFSGVIDLGGGGLAGNEANFVAKIAPDGGLVWSKNLGGAAMYTAPIVQLDASSGVVVCGSYNGTLNFGDGVALTNNQDPDLFVARLDPAGAPLFAKSFGGAGTQSASTLAVAPDGSLLLAGPTTGALDLGGGPLAGKTYLARFGPSGALLQTKTYDLGLGAAQGDFVAIHRIAVDATGNVTAVGTFKGPVDFGAGTVASKGIDAFILHFDPDLKLQWARTTGDTGSETAVDVAVDPAGNIGVIGNFSSELSLGVAKISAAGSTDVFVARFDPAGTSFYAVGLGDADTQDAYRLVQDAGGNIVVTGFFLGSMVLGGSDVVSANPNGSIFLAKLGPGGVSLWGRNLTAADPASSVDGTSVQVDALGAVVLTGIATGPLDLGNGALAPGGGWDIFLAKLTP